MAPKVQMTRAMALTMLAELTDYWQNGGGADDVELSVPGTLMESQHEPFTRSPQPEGRADSPPNAEALPPKRTGSKEPHVECPGCVDFACVRRWRTQQHIAEYATLKWCRAHGLVQEPTCPVHGAAGFRQKGDKLICTARVGDNECRKRFHIWNPLVSIRNKITPEQVLQIIGLVGDNTSSSKIGRTQDIGRKTIERFMMRLELAAVKHQARPRKWSRMQVDETYVGKRKHGRGKRARLRGWWFITCTSIMPNGATGPTSWTLVKKRDKKTCEAVIRRHLLGTRSTVDTDGWAGYVTIGKWCRHRVVDHNKGFKSADGVHTNNAEGIHGCCKEAIRAQHGGHYGQSSRQLRRNVALATLKFGDGDRKDVPQVELWGRRMQQLFICMRDSFDPDAEDDLETISPDSEPEGADRIDDCDINQRLTAKGQPDKRVRAESKHDPKDSAPKKKKARTETASEPAPKKKKARKETAPEPAPKNPTIAAPPARRFPVGPVKVGPWTVDRHRGEEDLDDQAVLAIRRGEADGKGGAEHTAMANVMNLHAVWTEDEHDVMNGLRPGKLILSMSIRLISRLMYVDQRKRLWTAVDPEEGWLWMNAPEWKVPSPAITKKLSAALPVDRIIIWPIYYKQHWITVVLDRRGLRFDVMDSAREYAHADREAALSKVTRVLRIAWTVNMKPTLKACEQQGGTFDCGLFTIRNMIALMRGQLEEPLTDEEREAITREWLLKCWEGRDTGALPPFMKPKKVKAKASKKSKSIGKKSKSMKREPRSKTPRPTPAM